MEPVQRCEARARKGTGEGSCDTPLDERGRCPRSRQHLEED